MTFPRPFHYPESVHERRHSPAGYKNSASFKDWLRDEFTFRCVYCMFRERAYASGDNCFSVDHLIPRSADRGGPSELDYENMVYACCRCNASRGATTILNPIDAVLRKHLDFTEADCTIQGLTEEGNEVIRLLRLNDAKYVQYRRCALSVLEMKRENPDDPEVHKLYVHYFGYPDNLPDLRLLKPPEGNKITGSENTCYYARRERGELHETY
jgi:HNH endonuclease